MKIWLSPEILDWDVGKLYNAPDRLYDLMKPYKILEYTKKRFNEVDKYGEENEENLVLNDIVIDLKQAIEHREKELHKKFKFSQLSFAKPKKYEILEQFHIVQPFFANNLRLLRNEVIHEQRAPLGEEKRDIEELWEFVWYFLRSTDAFLARYIYGMFLYPFGMEGVELFHDDWAQPDGSIMFENLLGQDGIPQTLNMQGEKLPPNLFSVDEKEGWIELKVNERMWMNKIPCTTPACVKWFKYMETTLKDNGLFLVPHLDKKFQTNEVDFVDFEEQRFSIREILGYKSSFDRKYSMEDFILEYGEIEMEMEDRIKANEDIKVSLEQRIKEYLSSDKLVSFHSEEIELVGPNEALERFLRGYISLHVWY